MIKKHSMEMKLSGDSRGNGGKRNCFRWGNVKTTEREVQIFC